MIVSELKTLARKVNNDVKGGDNFSDSTTLHKLTVPANKRWFFLGGRTVRDVAATLKIHVHESGGDIIMQFLDDAAQATEEFYPQSDISVPANLQANGLIKWILDPGECIQFDYGVAQTANSMISCVVLEIEI